MVNLNDMRENFRKFAEETFGEQVSDHNIKGLKVIDKGSTIGITTIQVNGTIPDSLRPDSPNETILAIFETSRTYLVITPNRGGLKGEPYLFGKDEVVEIIYNEESSNSKG
jgi:hypothetical protein